MLRYKDLLVGTNFQFRHTWVNDQAQTFIKLQNGYYCTAKWDKWRTVYKVHNEDRIVCTG